jgi:hypothetical protein
MLYFYGIIVLSLEFYLKEIEKGNAIFCTLNNLSVAKITKISEKKNYLYEVLTTSPKVSRTGIKELKFIYKKLINNRDLISYLENNLQEE